MILEKAILDIRFAMFADGQVGIIRNGNSEWTDEQLKIINNILIAFFAHCKQ